MTNSPIPEKTPINKPPPTRSLFSRVLDVVILVSNVCAKSPLSFRAAALLAFGCSYLIRGLGDSNFPRPIISGLVILIGYYFVVGLYRLFIYNRFLDPLLAIPGPKVLLCHAKLISFRDTGYEASTTLSSPQKYTPSLLHHSYLYFYYILIV